MATLSSTSAACPIYRIIEKLSKKWSLLILRSFTEQKRLRFTDILETLPQINSRILSERLSEMEDEGLLVRTVENTKPIVISYEITKKGMDLRRVFDSFVVWAKKWGKSAG
jgi:DNA-binding HxlR family transcriptional regulator